MPSKKIPNPTTPPRRGRPPTDGETKIAGIHVRCTDEQRAAWDAAAASQDVPVSTSAWLRHVADAAARGAS
jgi:hypothetical protein